MESLCENCNKRVEIKIDYTANALKKTFVLCQDGYLKMLCDILKEKGFAEFSEDKIAMKVSECSNRVPIPIP